MDSSSSSRTFLLGALAGVGLAIVAHAAVSAAHRYLSTSHELQPSPAVASTSPTDLEDDILSEHFSRNIQFFGEDSQRTVAGSYVVVVGLGGVGSHAAHLLLRSGVGRLKLIDFDQVSLSSLNRHAVATRADVGLPKADVLADHLRRIVPEAKLEPVVAMFTAEAEEELLGGPDRPDFLIDAIDNVDTKVALLAACFRRKIPVLSVGGAAAKADPTRLRFVDISEASSDALARLVRAALRRYHGIRKGIQVLISLEKPRVGLTRWTPEQLANGNWHEYQTIPNFRVRTIPVLGTTPAIFGMAAASWVLCALADKPYSPEPAFFHTRRQYETLLEELQAEETRTQGHCDHLFVDLEELTYIVQSVWRGVSAHKLGIGDLSVDVGEHRRTAGLVLTRFDPSRYATPDNLILLYEKEAEELRALGCEAWKAKHPLTADWAAQVFKRLKHLYG